MCGKSQVVFRLILILIPLLLIESFCGAAGTKTRTRHRKITNPSSSNSVINILYIERLISYKAKPELCNKVGFKSYQPNESSYEPDTSIYERDLNTSLNSEVEKKLIANAVGIITRKGNVLRIETKEGPSFIFEDYRYDGTKYSEGDSEKCLYAGTFRDTGYHLVEISYMHDSSTLYFINPEVGTMISIRDEYTTYLKNMKLLILNNSPNPPFGLVVVDISQREPRVDLLCVSQKNSNTFENESFEGWGNKINAKFEGWDSSGKVAFKLLTQIPEQMSDGKSLTSIPTVFRFNSGGWHVSVPANDHKAFSERIRCLSP